MNSREEIFMRKALKSAHRSLKSGDVPVGAIIVHDNKIISRGYNRVELKGNSTEHAEIMAINAAIKKLGYKHLLDCEMYVTLEPCSMCAGAIVLARIKKLFIGTHDPKTGASGSLYNITSDERLNHRCEVHSGILQAECSAMLKDFFKELRGKKK